MRQPHSWGGLMVSKSEAIAQSTRPSRRCANATSAVISPDRIKAEALRDVSGVQRLDATVKNSRSEPGFYLNLLAHADWERGSRRVGCKACCVGQPPCLLVHSRKKPVPSSILRLCVGMLILPAADMSRLLRRRRSRLRRKIASKTTCRLIRSWPVQRYHTFPG
jgi:hypothetical protein